MTGGPVAEPATGAGRAAARLARHRQRWDDAPKPEGWSGRARRRWAKRLLRMRKAQEAAAERRLPAVQAAMMERLRARHARRLWGGVGPAR